MKEIGTRPKALYALSLMTILLWCAGQGRALAAAPTVPFEFACSTAQGRGTAPISYPQFRSWSDRYASITGTEPMTTTSAVDPISLSFARSFSYLSREGDNSKAYAQAIYDPRHRVLALCLNDDAWKSLSVVANVSPPPFGIMHADLASVATKHGIHLGSTVAQVESIYGRTRIVQLVGGESELSYLREIPLPRVNGFRVSREAVETWFRIVDGHITSMSIGSGF